MQRGGFLKNYRAVKNKQQDSEDQQVQWSKPFKYFSIGWRFERHANTHLRPKVDKGSLLRVYVGFRIGQEYRCQGAVEWLACCFDHYS